MADKFRSLMFTPAVLAAQERFYGGSYPEETAVPDDALGPEEISFIATRDSFYMSSVTETGWPYVQHRGGPIGFLRVVSPQELAFADYRGNRQMLSTGNLDRNDRVCLFLMDYPSRVRLKILGHAEVLDAREHPELLRQLAEPAMTKVTERIVRITVVSYDWNCPKYITPRFTVAEVSELIEPLRARVRELEDQLINRESRPRPASQEEPATPASLDSKLRPE